MIQINTKEALEREERRKKEVKPLPSVIGFSVSPTAHTSSVGRKILQDAPPQVRKSVREFADKLVVDEQIKECWSEISRIKTERGKLSTRTAGLVTEIAQRLMAESSSTARSFMSGDLPMPELAEHYSKIEALTQRAAAVWDEIRYIEQHGKPPVATEASAPVLEEESPDISVLQHNIRRLDDRIHKTRKKLAGKVPKNPSRVALWKEKLALDEARRDELKRKLKTLQHGERAERTGA